MEKKGKQMGKATDEWEKQSGRVMHITSHTGGVEPFDL
jgi:hypothetical protein